jgi:hypothetical protein
MLRRRRNEQRFAPPTKALAPSHKTGGRFLVAGSGSPTALIAAALLRLRRNEEAKGAALRVLALNPTFATREFLSGLASHLPCSSLKPRPCTRPGCRRSEIRRGPQQGRRR